MSFDLTGLGTLVRVFREARSLSQQSLASQVRPPTNRSAIAHLEQGLRVPPAGVLQAVCEHLQIPRPLWERFVLRADSFRAGSLARGSATGPRYIAVAGMIGSGKTTLARGLANALGYQYLPEDMSAKDYIDDLTSDPSRWAFEAQLAFLSSKALSLQAALSKNIPLVLDRSLTEDIEVFAEHFRSRNEIDQRSFATYQSLAQYFVGTLPAPDLLLYCHCELETSQARVNSRRRRDTPLHSADFLASIHNLYENWIRSYSSSTICIIHAEEHDWREEKTIQTIVREIDTLWSNVSAAESSQLDLFGARHEPPQLSTRTEVVQVAIDRRETRPPTSAMPALPEARTLPFPSVYIAAPFTAAEEFRPRSSSGQLFEAPHGRIPRKRYRRSLESIDAALRSLGFHTTLPHRDINAWGAVQLAPQKVAESCSKQVAASDVFVGIPAMSHGTHYEFGVARGLNKPALLIDCAELPSSFISNGFRTDDRLLVVQAASLGTIAARIRSEDVTSFFGQFVPLTRGSR